MKNSSSSKSILFIYLGECYQAAAPRHLEIGMSRYQQLGLLYLAAVVKSKGMHAEVWDRNVSDFDHQQLLQRVTSGDYAFVGFYSDTLMKPTVIKWIKELNKHNESIPPIVVGGPAHLSAADFLNIGAQIVAIGEAEKTILEIVDYFEGAKPIEDVKGIAYQKDGQTLFTEPQKPIENLDEIPFPDRSAIDLNEYFDWRLFTVRLPFVSLMTSRGCPFQCTYCAVPALAGRRIRQRSVDNVLAEIDEVVTKYGVRYIDFEDDNFAMSPTWLKEFCEKLIERNYDLEWHCTVHHSIFKQDGKEKMALMKKAGCILIMFGLQSAHPQILKNVKRRPEEPEELAQVIRICRQVGLFSMATFIFGLPGDTEETIQTSVDYAIKTKATYALFFPLYRIEGSEIYNLHKHESVCELSNERVEALCRKAMFKIYTNPRVLFSVVPYLITKRRKFILKAFVYVCRLAGSLFRR